MRIRKTIILTAAIAGTALFLQGFAQKEHTRKDEKPTNLQILPKDISEQELHKVMREYSMALGVHCNYCHVEKPRTTFAIEGGPARPQMDFASDDKPEKNMARDMMRMEAAINAGYISKMKGIGHNMEQVTCVTCHNGRAIPLNSTDSLPAAHRPDMPH